MTLRFVDNAGRATERYPYNVNGSPEGITGLTTADGRYSILMPHPERVFRAVQNAWRDPAWGEDGPWLRLFRNARVALRSTDATASARRPEGRARAVSADVTDRR